MVNNIQQTLKATELSLENTFISLKTTEQALKAKE